MTTLQSLLTHTRIYAARTNFRFPKWRPVRILAASRTRQNFHSSGQAWAEQIEDEHVEIVAERDLLVHGDEVTKQVESIQLPPGFKEFKASYTVPPATFPFESNVFTTNIGKELTTAGFLQKVVNVSNALAFATVLTGAGEPLQIVFLGKELVKQIKAIRANSPISVTGTLARKEVAKDSETQDSETQYIPIKELEIKASSVSCLNSFPVEYNASAKHIYGPENRHLQIRFDEQLRRRLLFRSKAYHYIRETFADFQTIETPILFKSTPEGAREFLVPTRRPGFAYALPQSPQQYKQILMASGIDRYIQFARCFRDEDLRADRQPEFTQLDIEVAFRDGAYVMKRVTNLIKALYMRASEDGRGLYFTHHDEVLVRRFEHMTYDMAMSQHGSDKPDLRIVPLIHRIDSIVPDNLRSMLTSIKGPIIEVCKFRLLGSAKEVRKFVNTFMESEDAVAFVKNPDGPPGVSIFDPLKNIEGLEIFGFESAEALKNLFSKLPKEKYHTDETHRENQTIEEGDVLIIQARENLPFTGGSTMLGKFRTAFYKAAVEKGLIKADPLHRYLWVTDFPMFTLDNDTDPGQGGTAGFSATHHPFTAPKTPKDVELLLTDPLAAKADHYDLVVNGVELGGGSRRIHNVEVQKFVMRNVLKMSEERMADFDHLFSALASACPPHAGFALGFDRLIAVMTGTDSIKDVIAFPKSSKGDDLMVKSPSRVTDEQLKVYHLEATKPVEH